MNRISKQIVWAVLILTAVFAAGCAPLPITSQSQPANPTLTTASVAAFSDPFAYCAAVDTLDQPDARYTGPKITDAIITGFIKSAGMNTSVEPSDIFKQMTTWRCMNKKVYACNFGANLPCNSKANTDPNPTQAMTDYCKENQDSDFIPMSVTGHSTIYSWHCVKDTPEKLDQIDKADPAGFLSGIWYPVEPAP